MYPKDAKLRFLKKPIFCGFQIYIGFHCVCVFVSSPYDQSEGVTGLVIQVSWVFWQEDRELWWIQKPSNMIWYILTGFFHTYPETHSEFTPWMVGIRSFPFGAMLGSGSVHFGLSPLPEFQLLKWRFRLGSPSQKKLIILVVTVTGQGDNPKYTPPTRRLSTTFLHQTTSDFLFFGSCS